MGLILFVDAVVYLRTNKSLLNNHPKKFWSLFVLSIAVWWFYELLNISINNWVYTPIAKPEWLMKTIAFSTVIPAVFEIKDFLLSTALFKKTRFKIEMNNKKAYWFILIGIFMIILPFVLPRYTFPLVWLSMFFLLDPINYLAKRPSLISDLSKGKSRLFLCLALAALTCGFFWEFWNYWAPAKWHYVIPFVGFCKIFEMPVLGYLGYIPFGWSLYAIYIFAKGLFR